MIQHALFALGGAWVAWALLCWLSPYIIAKKLRVPVLFTIPPYLVEAIDKQNVFVYESDDLGLFGGYAFSSWLGFVRVIVLNATFWRFGGQKAKEFLLAHELGHHVKGHVSARLISHIFLLHALPPVKRWLELTENAADEYAEKLTGLTAAVLWGPVVVSEAGGSGQTEERKA